MINYKIPERFKHLRKAFFALMLWLLSLSSLSAQQTVTGNLQLLAPYPAYLADYANPSLEKAVLTLTMVNPELSSQRVRLKMLLEKGNSLVAYNNDVVTGEAVINLALNIPQRLSAATLAPYFRLENLQGMTPDVYNRLLTEGMYRVTFEVYNYTSNERLGSFSQQMWIVLNDVPLLNMPQNGENIQITTANPKLNFQWIPRGIQSAGQLDYELTLVELLDDYGNATQQFLSSTPYYTTTIQTFTAFEYGVGCTPLRTGFTYAWRVRAKARQGITNVALFKNDGYSDIFTFKYMGTCATPTGLAVEAKSSDQLNVTWSPSTVHSAFKVAYRKASTTVNWEWVEQVTPNTFLNLTGLEPATQYQVKVGGICGPNLISYTLPLTAKTLDSNQVKDITCGQTPTLILTNKALQPSLYINDVILAGDFPVTLTQVTGSNGNFSGQGWVKVPWLADTKIRVKFSSITVNTDKKLIDGFIETTYDPNWGNIANIDQIFNANFINEVVINVPIGSINLTNDVPPKIVIKDANGVIIQTLPGGSNYTIKDSKGNEWAVSRDGTITKLAPKVGEPIASSNSGVPGLNTDQPIASDVPVITFEKHTTTKYGFDGKVTNTAGVYEELPCTTCGSGKNYAVAYKSVASGDSDLVIARVLINPLNTPLDSIKFRTGEGRAIYAVYQGNSTWQMAVKGSMNDKIESVYATAIMTRNGVKKQEICGKLNFVSYDKIKQKVVLIPVNGYGATLDATQVLTVLNATFKQAVMDYTVEKKINFSTTAYNGGVPLNLDHGKLWSYSPEQRALINAYEQSAGKAAANTLYLFLVNKAQNANGEIVQGHTPLGKSYGFLFVGSTNFDMRTVPHEVAHGATLGLEHTFDGANKPAKTSTNNLLDYATGTELTYQQWKDIHEFKIRFKIGQDVEDGQMATVQDISRLASFKNTDGTYTFISPSGKPITLPATLKKILFSTGDNWVVKSTNQLTFGIIPFGTLLGFETDAGEFAALKSDNNILGYLKLGSTQYFEDKVTRVLNPTQAIIGVPCLQDGFIDFAVSKVNIGAYSVEVVNKGEGTSGNYDFLVGKIQELYSNPSNVKFIYAQLNPDLTDIPEVKEFILENEEYAKFGNVSALYVFTHANQIAQFRDAYKLCNVKYERVTPRLKFLVAATPIDNTNIVNYDANREKWLRSTVIDWVGMKISRYGEIQQTFDRIKNLTTINTAIEIRDLLYNVKDLNCVWYGIQADSRIHAIKKLIVSEFVMGSWLGMGNNYEYYISKLLSTTPESDYQLVINAFAENNYVLLQTLWDKVDGDNADACINSLTNFLLKIKRPIPSQCPFEVCREPCLTDCIPIWNVRENEVLNPSWQFKLFGQYDNLSVVTFSAVSTTLQADGSKLSKTWKNTGSPFEFVTLYFNDPFEYSSTALGKQGTIKKGDKFAVPLIWAYWFQRRYQNDKAQRELLAIADVTLMVATDGFGNALIKTLNVAFSTTYATVQFNRDYVNREFGEGGRNFLEAMDMIAFAQGLGNIAGLGIVKVNNLSIPSVSISWEGITTKIAEFRSNPSKIAELQRNLTTLASRFDGLIARAGEQARNLAQLSTDIKNKVFEIGVRQTFRNVPNNLNLQLTAIKLKITNAKYAVLILGNTEYSIFTGRYIDNLIEIEKNTLKWLPPHQFGIVIGYLDNVKYFRGDNMARGSLRMVKVGDEVYFEAYDGWKWGELVAERAIGRINDIPLESVPSDVFDNISISKMSKFSVRGEQGHSLVLGMDRAVRDGALYPRMDGILDIHIHGSTSGGFPALLLEGKEYFLYTPEHLADYIMTEFPNIRGVRLFCCWGSEAGSQRVADIIRKPVLTSMGGKIYMESDNIRMFMHRGELVVLEPQ